MPISVSCEFRQAAVVFAGEKLRCDFKFEYPQPRQQQVRAAKPSVNARSNGSLAAGTNDGDDDHRELPPAIQLENLAELALEFMESPMSPRLGDGGGDFGARLTDAFGAGAANVDAAEPTNGLDNAANGDEARAADIDEEPVPAFNADPNGDAEVEGVVVKASAIQQRLEQQRRGDPATSASSPKSGAKSSPSTNAPASGFLSWMWPFTSGAAVDPAATTAMATATTEATVKHDDADADEPPSPVPLPATKRAATHGSLDAADPMNVSYDSISDRESIASGRASRAALNMTTGGSPETLALAFVQLVGYAIFDQHTVNADEELAHTKKWFQTGGGGLSLSEMYDMLRESRAYPVLASPPTVLFGNLTLAGGDRRTYTFETILPSVIPPTHRGKSMRVVYKLMLGIQKTIYEKPFLVQLPFRVLNCFTDDGFPQEFSMEFPIMLSKEQLAVFSDDDRQQQQQQRQLDQNKQQRPRSSVMTVANAGASRQSLLVLDVIRRSEGELRDMLKQELRELPDANFGRTLSNIAQHIARTPPVAFDIRKEEDRICKLQLQRSSYRLGESIQFTMDFSAAEVPAYHVSIYLDQLDIIEPEVASKRHLQYPEWADQWTRRTVDEHHEYCMNMSRLSGALTIPPTATSDFTTNFVSCQWELRLELTTGYVGDELMVDSEKPFREVKVPVASAALEGDHQDRDVSTVTIDQRTLTAEIPRSDFFECCLPIKVLPSDWDNCRMFPPKHHFMMVPAAAATAK